MTIVIDNVDIDELNGQRMELISQIWDDKDSRLWGLVNMLDDIVDRYITHLCCDHDYESGCVCCRQECESK